MVDVDRGEIEIFHILRGLILFFFIEVITTIDINIVKKYLWNLKTSKMEFWSMNEKLIDTLLL